MDANEAATTLAQRVQEDPAFRERVMDNPIAVMGELGIERDLAWELLSHSMNEPADEEVVGHGWCGSWLTRAGCQCTGFKAGCAVRSAAFYTQCTTRRCG
jgi:hypothetical protein